MSTPDGKGNQSKKPSNDPKKSRSSESVHTKKTVKSPTPKNAPIQRRLTKTKSITSLHQHHHIKAKPKNTSNAQGKPGSLEKSDAAPDKNPDRPFQFRKRNKVITEDQKDTNNSQEDAPISDAGSTKPQNLTFSVASKTNLAIKKGQEGKEVKKGSLEEEGSEKNKKGSNDTGAKEKEKQEVKEQQQDAKNGTQEGGQKGENDNKKKESDADSKSNVESCADEWIRSFCFIKFLLIIFGQWPFGLKEETQKGGYLFKFTWKCLGFYFYVWTLLFTAYGLASSGINVATILMKDKSSKVAARTKSEIIEHGLLERHTMIVIIMLGSYGLNLVNSVLIFFKRKDIAEIFSKWTYFLHSSKLRSAGFQGTYTYAGPALINYSFVVAALVIIIVLRVSATFIGGPTVVTIMFARQFLPKNYLENFTNSGLHYIMHSAGLAIFFYVTFTSNVNLYLFLWLLRTVQNATDYWNSRLRDTLEMIHLQNLEDTDPEDRRTISLLYEDHIGLVRMIGRINDIFAGILEPWLLFFTIRIVYQFYLAALVIQGNGSPVTKENFGKYFIRKRDYIPVLVICYENTFMVTIILLASSWLEDTAYESYDDLREISLLEGPLTAKEALFYLTMFQSYTSTTKMAIYGWHFFTIDRYTVLHVLSAIMSNFLVVYQFRPLFDVDTTQFENIRAIVGDFLTKFERLDKNHYKLK